MRVAGNSIRLNTTSEAQQQKQSAAGEGKAVKQRQERLRGMKQRHGNYAEGPMIALQQSIGQRRVAPRVGQAHAEMGPQADASHVSGHHGGRCVKIHPQRVGKHLRPGDLKGQAGGTREEKGEEEDHGTAAGCEGGGMTWGARSFFIRFRAFRSMTARRMHHRVRCAHYTPSALPAQPPVAPSDPPVTEGPRRGVPPRAVFRWRGTTHGQPLPHDWWHTPAASAIPACPPPGSR